MSDSISQSNVNLPSHMTDEEVSSLRFFVLTYATMISMGLDAGAEVAFEKFTSNINSLLTARAQEIERLQARQITPDMIAVWDEYRLARDEQSARYLINAIPDMRSDLWHAFIALMEGKAT